MVQISARCLIQIGFGQPCMALFESCVIAMPWLLVVTCEIKLFQSYFSLNSSTPDVGPWKLA